jgi:pSer/pThr/pTyr-binding forkhead associated (FHA) protein
LNFFKLFNYFSFFSANDLAIANNRYISSVHCIIEYDNGRVFIRDTSSNGTLINRTKKINKNESVLELQSSDIIHLVFRKDEPQSS